ncbi:HAMP domain-containing sensor histidine kinase [Oscillatoria amoena NRMC-F 0135]|nr:HAMP domain-containing sensor histidine kinase [Oscillatoria amoena NRMC-F 0135]
MKKAIRNLIIGKGTYIESWSEYRQVMLSGQYALLAVIVIVFYLVLELSQKCYQVMPLYLGALGLLGVVLYLHRKGDHCVANYFLFSTINVLLFLIASSETIATGAFVYFIPVAIGSFAVFNYKQRFVAMAFSALSFVLFAISFGTDLSILPWREYTRDEIQMSLAINSSFAFPSTLVAVYLLISINHKYAIELRDSNKLLKKVNEELDRFVYSTSHDLRAPLASVTGLINLSINNPDMDEVRKYLSMMNTRVKSLDNFIRDITDYSRNNRLKIVHEPVNIHTLGNQVWDALQFSPEANGIVFLNELPETFVIENDSRRLHVVFTNLIANAIRYHDHRKEHRYIRLYHQNTPTSFSLHVEDNGQGIAPEIQKRVFEMFYRGNESSQGSGLGLYIVKETIGKLSGSVQLQSVPRHGSTFTVTLPMQQPQL